MRDLQRGGTRQGPRWRALGYAARAGGVWPSEGAGLVPLLRLLRPGVGLASLGEAVEDVHVVEARLLVVLVLLAQLGQLQEDVRHERVRLRTLAAQPRAGRAVPLRDE